MIKAVIFDCFGVLYEDASNYFIEQNIADYDKIYKDFRRAIDAGDCGLVSQAEVNQSVASLTGLDLEFVEKNLQAHRKRNDYLIAYSQSIRSEYKVGMLSNVGEGVMDPFFGKNELDELFDAVVLSYEVKVIKPSPKIFEIMAERLGVSPGECVLIDDRKENCAGADAVGMSSIHFLSNEQALKDLSKLLESQSA